MRRSLGKQKASLAQMRIENCCTFLCHIRVKSIDELKTRILQGIEEMNQAPMML